MCTEPHILKSLINQDDAEQVSYSLFSPKSARGYLFLFNLQKKKKVLQALLENVLP